MNWYDGTLQECKFFQTGLNKEYACVIIEEQATTRGDLILDWEHYEGTALYLFLNGCNPVEIMVNKQTAVYKSHCLLVKTYCAIIPDGKHLHSKKGV